MIVNQESDQHHERDGAGHVFYDDSCTTDDSDPRTNIRGKVESTPNRD